MRVGRRSGSRAKTCSTSMVSEARPKKKSLSASVMASQLALFVSLVVAPSKFGEPGPLRFSLTTHRLEHVQTTTSPACAGIATARPARISGAARSSVLFHEKALEKPPSTIVA